MTKEINKDATYRHIGTILGKILETDLSLRKAAAHALDQRKMSRLLKIKDAAKIAGVSLATLHRAMNEGRLNFVRPCGKRRRIPEHCLTSWLNGDPQPRSAGEVMESMGLLKAFGISTPTPTQERKDNE